MNSKETHSETHVLPVFVEEPVISKQPIETGRVHLKKRVHERNELIDEPTLHEKVSVERVPINRRVSASIPTRYEGDTLIISLMEEVAVVEKHFILKEELRVTKHQEETHAPQEVTLRCEEVVIERTSPNSQVE